MNASLVLRELGNRPHRTVAGILGVAIGVALLVAVNAVSDGYSEAMSLPFRSLGADIVVTNPGRDGSAEEGRSMRGVRIPFSTRPISADDMARLSSLEHVAEHSRALHLWEFAVGGFRSVMGVDLSHPGLGPVRFQEWIVRGRPLERSGEILLERHFAKFQHVDAGGTMEIGGRTFSVAGLLEIREGAQVSAANAYMSLEDAQALLPGAGNPANIVYLRLRDPAMQDAVRRSIGGRMPGLAAGGSSSFLELAGGMSALSGRFAWMMSVAALIGSAFLVLRTMTAGLVERLPEIGILKALGWTDRDIRLQLIGESAAQCLLGGILGVAMGYGCACLAGSVAVPVDAVWELNPVPPSVRAGIAAPEPAAIPISLSPGILAAALAFSLAIAAAAAWMMGRITSRMRPSAVLGSL